MSALAGYADFLGLVKTALLYAGIVVAVVCAFDWAVRTRRINPFSKIARFFRARIDPLMRGVEKVILRAGGSPASAPWWALVAYVVFGILLITLLQFVGDILTQVTFAVSDPRQLPRLLLSWAFAILRLAVLVRVLSTWLPVSPYSKWIRWSYSMTNWMILPLSRIIPRMGVIDVTPIVAWFLLNLVERVVLSAF
jgi:YggT family protein